MFKPIFQITNTLLQQIKQISAVIAGLNHRVFPNTVLMEFERSANSLSAFASTSIEGNPLPLTDVKRILKNAPQHIRDTEREVLNYNAMLEQLNAKIRRGTVPLSTDLLCTIQRQVTQGLLNKYRCGKLRKEPVFVNDPRTAQPIYLPPDHGDVPSLLEALVRFVQVERKRLDPLIVAGIFHKQFVIIHPFVDGNGRTARLATKAILADMGLNTFNLFSFENYYNQNVATYFQTVGARGNYYKIASNLDCTEWLEYFTEGILDELLRVQKTLEKVVASPATQLQNYHNKILAYIQRHGFITDSAYAKLTKRAKATRALDFKKLLMMGLIERFGRGPATHYKLKA